MLIVLSISKPYHNIIFMQEIVTPQRRWQTGRILNRNPKSDIRLRAVVMTWMIDDALNTLSHSELVCLQGNAMITISTIADVVTKWSVCDCDGMDIWFG